MLFVFKILYQVLDRMNLLFSLPLDLKIILKIRECLVVVYGFVLLVFELTGSEFMRGKEYSAVMFHIQIDFFCGGMWRQNS